MGKAVKSNSYHLLLLPQTRATTKRSILSCLFPSSLWEMAYPPTKCHSLRLVILRPVRQLASDMLQVRHVISSCLDPVLYSGRNSPTPHLWLWLVMPGTPVSLVISCSCCFHLSFSIRAVFSVAIFGWVKRITFTRKITGDNTHLLSTFSAKISETENFNSYTKRCAVAVVRLIYNPHDFM